MTRNYKNEQKKLLAFLCTCFFFIISCLPCVAFDAAASVAGEIKIDGLFSIDREELLYLLDIQPGQQIDKEHIRLGIKRAFLKGIFQDISIETSEGETTDVTITVRERDFIKKISVDGC